jgi:glutamyl-tRNA synthetase
MSVRVRFAPSPTGYLHVGGLRTALYNYLFAKHHGGKCILRIEDTDRTRLVENATEMLIDSLSWAGINFDEGPVQGGDCGPYIQSQRFDLYREYCNKLIDSGAAYYAFDNAEEIDAMRDRLQKAGLNPKYDRTTMKNHYTLGEEETKKLLAENVPHVVRLKVPMEEDIRFTDIIRGDVSINGREVDDQVLLKSDGFPTYHLANVIDDYSMKITHVIRGEEWLTSTPKHVLLYDAFGWERPQFAHLPLLLNKDKSKLSKRQGDVAVEDYRAKGYFKDTIVNFVALLGWNPTADREIYTLDELISSFSLEKVNKGGAVFDIQKLEWMNAQYLKALDPDYLAQEFMPMLEEAGINGISNEYAAKCITLFKERLHFLSELIPNARFLFENPTEFEEAYLEKHWKENTMDIVMPLVNILKNEEDYSHQNLHDKTKEYVESAGLKLKDVIHPLRLMITGRSVGAGMFETMEIVGREKCIQRYDYFIEKYGK